MLHNPELYVLCSSHNIIKNLISKQVTRAGQVARMEQFRNAYRVLVGKPEVKRPLGRPRRRWEDNIKMDLRLLMLGIDLTQNMDQWRAYVRAV